MKEYELQKQADEIFRVQRKKQEEEYQLQKRSDKERQVRLYGILSANSVSKPNLSVLGITRQEEPGVHLTDFSFCLDVGIVSSNDGGHWVTQCRSTIPGQGPWQVSL